MNKEEVKKIAHLARLELTCEEVEHYSKQLSHILEYINKLQELNTDDIELSSQVTGLLNVMQDDAVLPSDMVEEILQQVPEVEGNGVKVKSVF